MQFEKGNLYHIYNQGNNRQKIFFINENYLYFLRKIKIHILPYADILAWCLMPNHFHLMVLVNFEELYYSTTDGVAQSHTVGTAIGGATSSRTPNFLTRSFNHSIGIVLASYTRAINKQRGLSGSLFRKKTKAECITCSDGIMPSFFKNDNGITQINILQAEEQYPQICFNYIHQNPVNAGLVKNATDWEYSSAKDFAGLRKGKLINKKVAAEYINL